MSAWTSVADLSEQLRRRGDKGELLAERVMSPDLFPLRLSLRTPTSTELSEKFYEVRNWAAALQQGACAGYRLAIREVRHRVIGHNGVPAEAWVDTLDDALRLIGKASEARSFDALLAATKQQHPALAAWLQRQTLARPRRPPAAVADRPKRSSIAQCRRRSRSPQWWDVQKPAFMPAGRTFTGLSGLLFS